jgi:hypothetical protein
MARDDDPAPPGTVLYAVQIGDACLIGTDAGQAVVGRRPDGRCLAP